VRVFVLRSDDAATEPPIPTHIDRYVSDASGSPWRKLAGGDGFGPSGTGSWMYTLATDKFWGCGGSEKLVATDEEGRSAVLARDLRPEVFPVEIASGPGGVVALIGTKLHSISGRRMRALAEVDGDFRPRAVDAWGNAVGLDGDRLLRWSPRGGWRVLLE
jgi:hypothetical protein